jgi:hypothetical protein
MKAIRPMVDSSFEFEWQRRESIQDCSGGWIGDNDASKICNDARSRSNQLHERRIPFTMPLWQMIAMMTAASA